MDHISTHCRWLSSSYTIWCQHNVTGFMFWCTVENELGPVQVGLSNKASENVNLGQFTENINPVAPIIQPPKCYKYNCSKYHQKRHQPKIKLINYQVNYNLINQIWIWNFELLWKYFLKKSWPSMFMMDVESKGPMLDRNWPIMYQKGQSQVEIALFWSRPADLAHQIFGLTDFWAIEFLAHWILGP